MYLSEGTIAKVIFSEYFLVPPRLLVRTHAIDVRRSNPSAWTAVAYTAVWTQSIYAVSTRSTIPRASNQLLAPKPFENNVYYFRFLVV
jgi:hypothetical protein